MTTSIESDGLSPEEIEEQMEGLNSPNKPQEELDPFRVIFANKKLREEVLDQIMFKLEEEFDSKLEGDPEYEFNWHQEDQGDSLVVSICRLDLSQQWEDDKSFIYLTVGKIVIFLEQGNNLKIQIIERQSNITPEYDFCKEDEEKIKGTIEKIVYDNIKAP